MLRKALEPGEGDKSEDLIQNLLYFRTPSLPHLLALLFRPPKAFPPDDTSLLVVDSISGPFPSYFPNPTELRARLAQSDITDRSKIQWLMSRRWNVTSDLANHLMKLATTRQLAVLAINQTHTKIKGQPRATLCPVLAGGTWENCISTRIVLYRDFCTVLEDDLPVLVNARFAEIMKRSGRILALRLEENIVPFATESVSFLSYVLPQSINLHAGRSPWNRKETTPQCYSAGSRTTRASIPAAESAGKSTAQSTSRPASEPKKAKS